MHQNTSAIRDGMRSASIARTASTQRVERTIADAESRMTAARTGAPNVRRARARRLATPRVRPKTSLGNPLEIRKNEGRAPDAPRRSPLGLRARPGPEDPRRGISSWTILAGSWTLRDDWVSRRERSKGSRVGVTGRRVEPARVVAPATPEGEGVGRDRARWTRVNAIESFAPCFERGESE